MNLDWLDAFLITGLFQVVMVTGLALLLHLQLGLTRIANFGVVGFWGLGMYAFGVLYVQVDWAFGDPWQFLVCAALASLVAGLAGAGRRLAHLRPGHGWRPRRHAWVRDRRADPGHHRGRPDRRLARPRRSAHPVRCRQGEGGRVRLAARPDRGGRRHLPLCPAGPPLALRPAPHRHRRQRGTRPQPGQVHVPHQALDVRPHLRRDGPARRDVRGHAALPRHRQHRRGRHPGSHRGPRAGWHRRASGVRSSASS